MNLKELLEKRNALQEDMKKLIANAETEKRTLNDDEVKTFNEKDSEIRSINDTINAILTTRKLDEENNNNIINNANDSNENRSVEERELESFENFVSNVIENRDDPTNIQLTQGANGSIVPLTIANRIIKGVRDTVPFLQFADVITTNGTLAVPVYTEDSTNAINADYLTEGNSLTDNVGKFTSVNLTGYVIGALALISNKLISNTDINVTDFIVNECIRAISEKLELEFVVGTSEKITGILSSTSRVTTASASAITYDELLDLMFSIKKVFRDKAKWIMNDSTYRLLCKLKDAENRYYFDPEKYNILGHDVIISDSMPSIAASAKTIWFGDLSGYTIKETKSCEIQVLREKYADKNMIGVIGYVEYDGKITDSKKMGLLTMHA